MEAMKRRSLAAICGVLLFAIALMGQTGIAISSSELSIEKALQLVDQIEGDRLDETMRALQDLDPYFSRDGFRRLDKNTQEFIRSIVLDEAKVDVLRKAVVDPLKREPQLTMDEVKWLVEIEDRLIEAGRGLVAARTTIILAEWADKEVFRGGSEMRLRIMLESGKAQQKKEKSVRDLRTLLQRLQLRSKQN
ncbi:MAG: hypothetical protein ACRECD_10910 [Burkholderiaceae bacterium]